MNQTLTDYIATAVPMVLKALVPAGAAFFSEWQGTSASAVTAFIHSGAVFFAALGAPAVAAQATSQVQARRSQRYVVSRIVTHPDVIGG